MKVFRYPALTFSAVALFAVAALVQAQTNGSNSQSAVIRAELTSQIDAKKAKEGDPVQAKVTQGNDSLPKGSKLTGHVAEVKAASGDAAPTVAIAFDKAEPKGKTEAPFHAVVVSAAVPLSAGMRASAADSSIAVLSGGNLYVQGGAAAQDRTAGSVSGSGVTFVSQASDGAKSVFSSTRGNVRLDNGTRLVLRVVQ